MVANYKPKPLNRLRSVGVYRLTRRPEVRMLAPTVCFIKCLVMVSTILLISSPALLSIIGRDAIAFKTGREFIQICESSLQKSLLVFWLIYSLLVLIPNAAILIFMTLYWVIKFYLLSRRCKNTTKGRVEKVSVWGSKSFVGPRLSATGLNLVGIKKVPLFCEYRGRPILSKNGEEGRWAQKEFVYSLPLAQWSISSLIRWFLVFVYTDLFLLNFHKTFRLVLLAWPRIHSAQWSSVWPIQPSWYKADFCHNLQSPVPSLNPFMKAYYLSSLINQLNPLISPDELRNLKLSRGVLSDYLVEVVLLSLSDCKTGSYRIAVVADKSGLLIVRELELYVDNRPCAFSWGADTAETYVPRSCNLNHPKLYGAATSKRITVEGLGVTDKWTFSERLHSVNSNFS